MGYDWITARDKSQTRFTKNCLYCGERFGTNYPNQKYHSRKCAYLATKKLSRERECPICSDKVTGNGNKIYCSEKCSNKAQYQQKGKNKTRIEHVFDRIATLRWQIFNRDNFRCQYCGRTPSEDHAKLHLDHIKPKADGGSDDFDNRVTACDECNLGKSDIPLRHKAEFKARLN